MVEVFRTNINHVRQSKLLVKKLQQHFPQSSVNFDLDDCDKVLRVEGVNICPDMITMIVTRDGYVCEALL
jgi:hypothetical protein